MSEENRFRSGPNSKDGRGETLEYGVAGFNSKEGTGLFGFSEKGIGIFGASNGLWAIEGISSKNDGVRGTSEAGNGVSGAGPTSGVSGIPTKVKE